MTARIGMASKLTITTIAVADSLGLTRECGEGLVVHVPLFQNRKNGLVPKTRPQQLTKDSSRLLLIFGFHQPFAAQILPRLPLFVYVVINRSHRFLDDLAVYPFGFQVSNHTPATELLVVAAKRGIGRGIAGVVEIAAVFQPPDHQ